MVLRCGGALCSVWRRPTPPPSRGSSAARVAGEQGGSVFRLFSPGQSCRKAMAERCVNEQVSAASTDRKASSTAGKPLCWQHRLFGKQLARCSYVNDTRKSIDSAAATLVHEDGRPACEIVGMYFSFVNPGATCDDFTRQLVELYASVNGGGGGSGEKKKKFEVVHVVLWSNVTEVLDFDESFRAHVADLPWLAVPNRDYERKVRIFFSVWPKKSFDFFTLSPFLFFFYSFSFKFMWVFSLHDISHDNILY